MLMFLFSFIVITFQMAIYAYCTHFFLNTKTFLTLYTQRKKYFTMIFLQEKIIKYNTSKYMTI